MIALAHSPNPPIGPQTYLDHISNVEREARANAGRAAGFYAGEGRPFIEDVAAAAAYHDLGKLDVANQGVLRDVSRRRLPISHEDAGVARLLECNRSEAAVLVAAHHAGLFDQQTERTKGERAFRRLEVADHVDQQLSIYSQLHSSEGAPVFEALEQSQILHYSGFERRVGLSCLVDADHGDTARHYGNQPDSRWPNPRWQERLDALDRYMARLPGGAIRDEQRARVYAACREAPLDPRLRACEAPVGSGKTTAVMAHLLRVAAEQKLRHIFVVLPYVNIVKQSVDVYRRALVLPGENASDIVAEHDHHADFASLDLRQLATLWRSPIVVTTAVQFFETLGAYHPARLRKLHELPGSAAFIDEAHAALPAHLWPQVWLWLQEWTSKWRGHLALASGSLARFWELREFVDEPQTPEVPDLVPSELLAELAQTETRRVAVSRQQSALGLQELITFVTSKPGPRLLILNTVQSAAAVAHKMQSQGHPVLHLSTALTPADRSRMLARVRSRLEESRHDIEKTDWTLVATSCVEAGVDLSFRTGFRESASVASIIQVSGRVSRGGEHPDAEVWDFRVNDPLLPPNPTLEVARRVLRSLLQRGAFEEFTASQLALEAMRLEVTEGQSKRSKELLSAELNQDHPGVADKCRVIEADTRLVVIEPEIVDALQSGRQVDRYRLIAGSVQIWSRRVTRMPVVLLRGESSDPHSLFAWTGKYDPDLLGYMTALVSEPAEPASVYIA